MQGIYNYIPEMNHISVVYNVEAILWSHFMVCVMLFPMIKVLYFDINTFRNMCTVPSMAVFCSSFMSWLPGMVLRYFVDDFETVQVSPIIIDITFVFTIHVQCISIPPSWGFDVPLATALCKNLPTENTQR